MPNCIIHPEFVAREVRSSQNTLLQRNLAFQALLDITTLLEEDPDVILIERGEDPASAADYYRPGEKVILYGAYRDGCLETARRALTAQGVEVEYHPTGSIPIFIKPEKND